MISFPLRMAWREARSHWRKFSFFFICIAIGVGAVVGVGLFATNVEQVILQDARSLLGGDLEVSLRRVISEAGQSVLDSLQRRNIEVLHITELVAMAAAEDPEEEPRSRTLSTQLVELKVVDDTYPFYGKVDTQPTQPISTLLVTQGSRCGNTSCFGAVVQESLLISLGVKIGSWINIGQARFKITGILIKEPDRVASAFSLGPRAIISREGLIATDLVKPGSRIRERYLLRIPDSQPLQPLVRELRGRLSQEGARVSTFRGAQPRIRRFLDQLSTYLGLIGLTVLFVGGIGVACTVQGFIAQKMKTIAILKTVGADAGLIIRMYLFHSLLMGGIGSIIGAGLGIMLQAVLPRLFQGLIPLASTFHLTGLPVVKGVALGLLSTVLFTLWPLLNIRHIPPALVFRQDVDRAHSMAQLKPKIQHIFQKVKDFFRDRARLKSGILMGVGLIGLAIWQARSISLGLFFIAAFLIALILLHTAALGFLRLTRVTSPRSFIARHAISNLQRPGNYTAAMTVAIGAGVMVIVSIALIKTSLLLALGDRIPTNAPTFFFIDIQPDQKEDFERLVQQWTHEATYELTPVIRTRLSAIEGRPIDRNAHKNKKNGWYFTREYVLTALADLPKDNVIVKGQWWDNSQEAFSQTESALNRKAPILSIEDEAARNLKIDIGSTLEFDILGASLSVTVASLRKVDWSSFSTNFFMILSPGSLEGAPKTYIATARVSNDEEIPLQRAIVAALPNVTAIKVGDVLENVAKLLNQLAWAIQGIAFLCILNGAIVMTAALSTTRFRRLYEAAILKAVGGTRRAIAHGFAMEFGLVGAMASLIGIGLACMLSWAVLYFFLDLEWVFQPHLLVSAFVLTILLALVIGFLSTYRLLGHPPLAVLRQE